MTYSVWFIQLFYSYHARNCDVAFIQPDVMFPLRLWRLTMHLCSSWNSFSVTFMLLLLKWSMGWPVALNQMLQRAFAFSQWDFWENFLLDNLSFIFSFPFYCGEYIQCQRQNRSMDVITLTFLKAAQQRMRWPKGGGRLGCLNILFN